MATTDRDTAAIVKEAKDRLKDCEDWESEARKRFVEDLKFSNADPDNGWQWPDELMKSRVGQQKPTLTINKTRQHNLQITNDAKQNKPGVTIRAVGDGSTYESAQVMEGVVRHIEYQSNAEAAYDTASDFQVQAGIGYWRIVTDYISDDSFDQEIFIRRVKNPLSVYLDPHINEADGSDARFGIVYEDVPHDQFKKEYPDHADLIGTPALGNTDGWLDKETIRIAEYYRKDQKKDTLCAFIVPPPYAEAGEQIIVRKSKMTDDQKAVYQLVEKDDTTLTRPIVTDEITWFKIAGSTVIDERPWLGKYIPIVRVVGEETIIEGKLDRKGHTRAMKDAQRMYNYWASEGTAQVALQSKSPYIAPAKAIEGLEEYWAGNNLDAKAILPYNSVDEQGNQIAAPQRQQPPQMASAYIQGMNICQEQMMMSSGQYQSQFGQNENATSGKAINERQRQGDRATYHFIDNLAAAIRFTGKIMIDLIPKIYDTERVIEIIGKDGEKTEVQIQPGHEQAYQEQKKEGDEVAAIFNPNVGRYDVVADVGPGYATRRQEAFNAMTQIATQNPTFMNVAGDLMFKSADFPLADELAERWSRTIPPAVKGDAPPPEVQQMQQQMQTMQNAIAALQEKLTNKDADHNIRSYEAETKRITAIGNSGPTITPDEIRPVFMQLMAEILSGGSPEGEEGQQQPQGMQMPQAQPQMPVQAA